MFTVVASIKGKKLKCMSSLRNTQKGYLHQTYKIALIKTAPGILSFNTFFSGISNCCICFTSSLFTEAIQAHIAPSFPPLFLTKYILHIPLPLSSQLFSFTNLCFITLTSRKDRTWEYTYFMQLHYLTTHVYIDAVTKQLSQSSFLHIMQL